MKLQMDSNDGSFSLSVMLTLEQGTKLREFVLGVLSSAPEEKDEILGVSRTMSAKLVADIRAKNPNPYWAGVHFGSKYLGSNIITDIRYVRTMTNAGLREAKLFVEKHISYRAPVAERVEGIVLREPRGSNAYV